MRRSDESWLALLAFFVVTALGSSLLFAALFTGVTVAVAGGDSGQTPADQQVESSVTTVSGVITDARCGARHTDSGLSASECARTCVRNGSRYLIVNGDKHYELEGDAQQINQLAGQRVSVTGVLDGGTIKVSTVSLQSSR